MLLGGVFETEQTKEVYAIASAILFEDSRKTGTGSLTMTLNNGSDGCYGDFFKTMDQGIMASTDDIVRYDA
jgi:hypothetical protein